MITDVALPDGDALDLLPAFQERSRFACHRESARSTLLTAVKAQQVGVFEYLPKPMELRSLIEVTQRAVETIGTPSRSSAKKTQSKRGPLIGRSHPMQDIFKVMARVVSTDLTVLVTGESGTGKELVARALHDLGSRRAGPFVAVNLAAIPHELVEAELFGKGNDVIAGKPNQHCGRFEQAESGTLFLDEVGDMPSEAQRRLLRVLQDGEYLLMRDNRQNELPDYSCDKSEFASTDESGAV